MKKRFNISILCFVLVVCCIIGAIPAAAKLEVMTYSSNGTDAEIGTMSVGEKIDINFAQLPSSFYSKWTDTDTYPEPLWTSSNSSVAGVDSKGVVTAKSAGNAIVYATFQYASAPKQVKFYITVSKNKSSAKIVRYSGKDRFKTAGAICDAGWSAGSTNTVILVNSNTYADALVSVPLAYSMNAPILLTGGKALESEVSDKIKSIKAGNILIIGGKGAVSSDIENGLKKSGYNVTRCSGTNRFLTALAIADYMKGVTGKKPTDAFVVTSGSYPDALSICSYAAISGKPILYVNNAVANNTPTYDYLKNNGIKNITIIGGPGVVSEQVKNDLSKNASSVGRIRGANRFLTSLEVAKTYSSAFGNDVMLSTGMNFPDALAGGVLAAKYKVPVLLVNKTGIEPEIESYIRLRNPANVYILGGEGVVPTSIVQNIF